MSAPPGSQGFTQQVGGVTSDCMCLDEGQTHSSSVLWPVLLASWENIGTSSPALVCPSPGRAGRGALVQTCVTDAIPWGEVNI